MKYKANAKEMVYKRRGNQTYREGRIAVCWDVLFLHF